jgi:hypothetical protein
MPFFGGSQNTLFRRAKTLVRFSCRACGKSRQSDSIVACAMTHISGFERSQLLLLPEAIDDYVVADNPVRFIDAFVDGLDLAAAGFKRVTPKVTGGFVTLLRIGYGFVGIQLQSRRSDDFTPRLHGRCPEGSVRSC